MSESVVADFTTQVIPDTGSFSEPVTGRVLMSDRRVVIATPETKRSFHIRDIFDIAYGSAPSELRRFFEDTVSIAYENGDSKHIALVEGADETVGRFTDLLFKAALNGTEALVKHPARIGGRVTDNQMEVMTTRVSPEVVSFDGSNDFSIEISTVSHFERLTRRVKGRERPVLSVRHMPDMESVTTETTMESNRKMNLLGRFLRIEYSQLKEDLQEMDVSEQEMEAMVGLYSGGDDASLTGVLGMEANQVTLLLNSLVDKGLVAEGSDGMTLTALGKLAVSSNIEQVNF